MQLFFFFGKIGADALVRLRIGVIGQKKISGVVVCKTRRVRRTMRFRGVLCAVL